MARRKSSGDDVGGLHEHVLSMSIVDTHSHMADASFEQYLAGEVGPFTSPGETDGRGLWELMHAPGFPDNIRPLMKRLYRDTANLAYKRAVTRGCRELHGVRGEFVDWDDRKLFDRARRARAGGAAALYLQAMDRAGIEHVLRLCSSGQMLGPDRCRDTLRLGPRRQHFLMYIDDAVACRRGMPCGAAAAGRPRTLGEHLHALAEHLAAARSAGAVGLKVGMALRRSLEIQAVSERQARRLFALRGELSPAQQTQWEDFMMHRLADEAARQDLPMVIHTGMLWGGHGDIARTRPGLLHGLFDAHPRTRFAILHATPYEGEAAYLCAMFANVYLDFTWTAMLSPTRFESTLNFWIETIPESKFMWGSDTSGPEAHLGVTLETREVIGRILCDRVGRGMMSVELARQFAASALRDNARRFYGLE